VDHPDRHHQVISVAIIVIATVIQDVTTLVTNVIQAQITTIMEVSTAILALADPIVASILVANASIPIVSVRAAIPSTAILVHAVMTQIAETDATVTVTETTTGGMEFEPEMKVDKKDLLLLNKDHHQHLLTMLEIKDFPVPLIKDQVLMLLFLLKKLGK